MRVLIAGAAGQLGRELQRTRPADAEVAALDRAALDITDREAVLSRIEALRPELIINAAAYTAVDGAESKPDLALRVNAEAAGYLASGAERNGARLLHVSTDFVFDGDAVAPYLPGDPTRPLGVYGHSKLAGECRVAEILPRASLILRTAWVYSAHGNNFVKTALRLMNERDEFRVVGDQRGSPTWARGLADTLWAFARDEEARGIYHWTDGGECSWYEFALAIFAEGRVLGLVRGDASIEEIPSGEYPVPARRPAYSVLDCGSSRERLGRAQAPWREQLQKMLRELRSP